MRSFTSRYNLSPEQQTWLDGHTAFELGKPRRSNPHAAGTEERRRWDAGWCGGYYGWRWRQRWKRALGDYSAWPPAEARR